MYSVHLIYKAKGSVQYRARFCIIGLEYSVLMQNEIIVQYNDTKKSYLTYKYWKAWR